MVINMDCSTICAICLQPTICHTNIRWVVTFINTSLHILSLTVIMCTGFFAHSLVIQWLIISTIWWKLYLFWIWNQNRRPNYLPLFHKNGDTVSSVCSHSEVVCFCLAGQERTRGQQFSSSEESWQRLQPVVECGDDDMTLTVRRRRAIQLLLDRGEVSPFTNTTALCLGQWCYTCLKFELRSTILQFISS